jgi:HAD superfamily hydrolase (TIGR01459 family)
MVARELPMRSALLLLAVFVPRACAALLTNLAAVADRYDCLLLDQFGVIHDGKSAYPGAVAAVSDIQQRGKKICVISNSSRRKGDTLARLRSLGFGPCEGDADIPEGVQPISVVTSGDLVFEGLKAGNAAPFDDLGVRCFVFGNGEEDEDYVRDCGKVASPINQADFVLARGLFSMLGAGPDMLRRPAVPYTAKGEEEVLEIALQRGLPLLVANPDVVRPDGKDSPMPGQLAKRYREMGSTDVRLVGKPHPLIYEACREILAEAGIDAGSARVAAVGDSLHHDVLGAARNGIDSVFICGGVHYEELGIPQSGPAQEETVAPAPEKLQALLDGFAEEHSGIRPTHTLAAFRL